MFCSCSTSNTHGTGCTLASAIAAELAKGATPIQAVRLAKAFVTDLLQASAGFAIGEGKQRPMNHGYEVDCLCVTNMSYWHHYTSSCAEQKRHPAGEALTHVCPAADHCLTYVQRCKRPCWHANGMITT